MKKKNYQQLKESIRMMKSQRSDTKKSDLIEGLIRKGIDEIIRQDA